MCHHQVVFGRVLVPDDSYEHLREPGHNISIQGQFAAMVQHMLKESHTLQQAHNHALRCATYWNSGWHWDDHSMAMTMVTCTNVAQVRRSSPIDSDFNQPDLHNLARTWQWILRHSRWSPLHHCSIALTTANSIKGKVKSIRAQAKGGLVR